MTVSYASFIAEFTEFDQLTETLVTSKITEAKALHDEAAWGTTLYDYAVKYTAANLLAMTPAGAPMAIRSDDGRTIYSDLFDRYYRPRNIRRGLVL